jgi:hypothetical protein
MLFIHRLRTYSWSYRQSILGLGWINARSSFVKRHRSLTTKMVGQFRFYLATVHPTTMLFLAAGVGV